MADLLTSRRGRRHRKDREDEVDWDTLSEKSLYGSITGSAVRRKQVYLFGAFCVICGLFLVYQAVLPSTFTTALPWPGSSLAAIDGTLANAALSSLEDPFHVRLDMVLTPLATPTPRFAPLKRLPYDVVHDFYISGRINSVQSPPSPLDIVYLFVNSSSPYFNQSIYDRAAAQGTIVPGNGGRWRENGELKGAIRSALSRIEGLGTVHLLTGVYPTNDTFMAQVPGWLDVNRLQEDVESGTANVGGLRWHTHAEAFRIPPEANTVWSEQEDAWRQQVIPNFSVFAIEGHINRLRGLSENIILSNDDMFFLSNLHTADFFTPLFGPVLRLDSDIILAVSPTAPDPHKVSQWSGLQTSNQLLSTRFPSRRRNYQHHVPKTLTKAALDEVAVIWADEIAEGARSGFSGAMDVDVPWLATWHGIERWREALLWVWTVVKMGAWSSVERHEVFRILGLEADDLVEKVGLHVGERESLASVQEAFGSAGWDEPSGTTYTFSSMDGHIPNAKHTTYDSGICEFETLQCLGVGFANASATIHATDLFKRLAFEKPECGNCLIKALVKASGSRGLAAFLPHEDTTFRPQEESIWTGGEPMLPLTKDWRTTDFSLQNVVRRGQDKWDELEPGMEDVVDLRRWSIKLLTRYAYVLGDSPIQFTQLRNWQQTDVVLKRVSDPDKRLAMLCLNDDTTVHQAAMVKERIETWIERMWPIPAPWERLGAYMHT